MGINTGGSTRSSVFGFVENGEGNILFDENSYEEFSNIIQVDDEPVIVRAHNLALGEKVLVEIVDGIGGGTHFTPYSREGKQVRLSQGCNVIALSIPGRYRFHLQGVLGASYVVYFRASMTHEFLLEALKNGICEEVVDEWVDTGSIRCVGDKVEHQQVNQFGKLKWVAREDVTWVDTGKTRCVGDKVLSEQVNTCGQIRWIELEAVTWVDTGTERINGEKIQSLQQNQCGQIRWVDSANVTWVDTGLERCNKHKVERQQVNKFGNIRWTITNVKCGYSASYAMPECGFIYQDGDDIDPEATVEVKSCDDKTIGYAYPTPRKDATQKLTTCNGTVIGYAVNRSDTAAECLFGGCAGNVVQRVVETHQDTKPIVSDTTCHKLDVKDVFDEVISNGGELTNCAVDMFDVFNEHISEEV